MKSRGHASSVSRHQQKTGTEESDVTRLLAHTSVSRSGKQNGRHDTLGVGLVPRSLEQALDRSASEADNQKALSLTAVNFVLYRGRPMVDYKALGGLLELSRHPHFASKAALFKALRRTWCLIFPAPRERPIQKQLCKRCLNGGLSLIHI